MIPLNRKTAVGVTATIVGGAATAAVTVTALLSQEWQSALYAGMATVWAMAAAAWGYSVLAHSCPEPEIPSPPAPVERGLQAVTLHGGPEDGAHYVVHGGDRDLAGAELTFSGADYQVTAPEHTCYRADFQRLTRAEEVDR